MQTLKKNTFGPSGLTLIEILVVLLILIIILAGGGVVVWKQRILQTTPAISPTPGVETTPAPRKRGESVIPQRLYRLVMKPALLEHDQYIPMTDR